MGDVPYPPEVELTPKEQRAAARHEARMQALDDVRNAARVALTGSSSGKRVRRPIMFTCAAMSIVLIPMFTLFVVPAIFCVISLALTDQVVELD